MIGLKVVRDATAELPHIRQTKTSGLKAAQPHAPAQQILEQINFELLLLSKFSFSPKIRFSAEPTPHCGALHFRAALGHLHFFKVCSNGMFYRVRRQGW
jgi:hypothetical protein